LAPSSANRIADARPIPLAPPVINAFFPSSLKLIAIKLLRFLHPPTAGRGAKQILTRLLSLIETRALAPASRWHGLHLRLSVGIWVAAKRGDHESSSLGSILVSRRCTSFNIRFTASNFSGGRLFLQLQIDERRNRS
jgi:hypothetical protein